MPELDQLAYCGFVSSLSVEFLKIALVIYQTGLIRDHNMDPYISDEWINRTTPSICPEI